MLVLVHGTICSNILRFQAYFSIPRLDCSFIFVVQVPSFDCRKAHTQATYITSSEIDSCGIGEWRSFKGWLVISLFFWQRTETYCLSDCSENWHIRLQRELAFDSAGNKTAPVARIWPSHMNSTYWKCCTHNHTDRYPANWRSYWDFNSFLKHNKLASAWQCCAIQESDNLDSGVLKINGSDKIQNENYCS